MQKKNILVFPCGSEIGLEIYRSLIYSSHFNIIGANSVEDHGCFVYKNYIGNLPFITSERILPSLNNLIKEYSIDAIYPTMDLVIHELKKIEENLGCKVISSPFETTELCMSKLKTYNYLSEHIKTPELFSSISEIKEFPVFLKPDQGYGSRGTFKADNKKEALSFLCRTKDKKYIILEYLPGVEYTVDCFTDRFGELRFIGPRIRNRILNGISVNTTLVSCKSRFEEMAHRINNIVTFRGAWFFQLKEDKNKQLTLLEIASRLGGSSGIFRNLGVNFALLTIFDFFNVDIDIIINDYEIELDRALSNKYKTNISYDTIYTDFDDCVVISNKLNSDLIHFLYKASDEGKKIILISKHKNDIFQPLEKYKLRQLFDEVIIIDIFDEKYKYVKSNNSIFIDDSFKERIEIKRRLGIPVFSPDMIECLL
jgi:hypothetical protein